MVFLPVFLTLFTIHALTPSLAVAATIEKSSDGNCGISIFGEIVAGDYDRFAALAKQTGENRICLNSPGGSWNEGVKIAEFVMDHFIGTYVGEGKICYSACAIVFLSGARKGRLAMAGEVKNEILQQGLFRLPDRTMHVKADVGFHAPYVDLPERHYSTSDIQTAKVAALQAFSRFLGMLAKGKGVPNDNNYIPKRFISQAMQKKPSDFLMIDSIDRAGWLRIHLVGYRHTSDEITGRDMFLAARNWSAWRQDKSFGEENEKAQPNYLGQLRYECELSFDSYPPFQSIRFLAILSG